MISAKARVDHFSYRILGSFSPVVLFLLTSDVVQSLQRGKDTSESIALLQAVNCTFQASFQMSDDSTYCRKISRVLSILLSTISVTGGHAKDVLANDLDIPKSATEGIENAFLRADTPRDTTQSYSASNDLLYPFQTAKQAGGSQVEFQSQSISRNMPRGPMSDHLRPSSRGQRQRPQSEDVGGMDESLGEPMLTKQSAVLGNSAYDPMFAPSHAHGDFGMHNADNPLSTWPLNDCNVIVGDFGQ